MRDGRCSDYTLYHLEIHTVGASVNLVLIEVVLIFSLIPLKFHIELVNGPAICSHEVVRTRAPPLFDCHDTGLRHRRCHSAIVSCHIEGVCTWFKTLDCECGGCDAVVNLLSVTENGVSSDRGDCAPGEKHVMVINHRGCQIGWGIHHCYHTSLGGRHSGTGHCAGVGSCSQRSCYRIGYICIVQRCSWRPTVDVCAVATRSQGVELCAVAPRYYRLGRYNIDCHRIRCRTTARGDAYRHSVGFLVVAEHCQSGCTCAYRSSKSYGSCAIVYGSRTHDFAISGQGCQSALSIGGIHCIACSCGTDGGRSRNAHYCRHCIAQSQGWVAEQNPGIVSSLIGIITCSQIQNLHVSVD